MFALLLVALFQPVAADLIDDPVIRDFSRVLTKAALADRSREHGAFVVRSREGLTYFVVWPAGGEKDRLMWRGAFPDGTVAILHTHPAWTPEPSKLDHRTARRSGVPVYVITPSRIVKTTGESATVVAIDWFETATGK